MSGGSYNYLCYKDIRNNIGEISTSSEEMGDDMIKEGFVDAGKELLKLALDIEMFIGMMDARFERLTGIMHDWEWYTSGDYGKHQFEEGWKEFLEGEK